MLAIHQTVDSAHWVRVKRLCGLPNWNYAPLTVSPAQVGTAFEVVTVNEATGTALSNPIPVVPSTAPTTPPTPTPPPAPAPVSVPAVCPPLQISVTSPPVPIGAASPPCQISVAHPPIPLSAASVPACTSAGSLSAPADNGAVLRIFQLQNDLTNQQCTIQHVVITLED